MVGIRDRVAFVLVVLVVQVCSQSTSRAFTDFDTLAPPSPPPRFVQGSGSGSGSQSSVCNCPTLNGASGASYLRAFQQKIPCDYMFVGLFTPQDCERCVKECKAKPAWRDSKCDKREGFKCKIEEPKEDKLAEVFPAAVSKQEESQSKKDATEELFAILRGNDAAKKDDLIQSILSQIKAISNDAAQGLRLQDEHFLVAANNRIEDVYAYSDGKGGFVPSPPTKDKEYVANLTRPLNLLIDLYCNNDVPKLLELEATTAKPPAQQAKPSSQQPKPQATDKKKKQSPIESLCELAKDVLHTIQKDAAAAGFSPDQGLNDVKRVFNESKKHNPEIFESKGSSSSGLFLETDASVGTQGAAQYKIDPSKPHHENIAQAAVHPQYTGLNVDPRFTTPPGLAVRRIFTSASVFTRLAGYRWIGDENRYNHFLRVGAEWPDVPCEGSDNANFDASFVASCYNQFIRAGVIGAPWGARLAVRSHETDFTYFHSMASHESVNNLPAPQSQQHLRDAIVNQARNWLFQAVNVPAHAYALDPKRFFWNLGRTCHMIADSYSCAHVVRNAANYEVIWFQDYVKQNSLRHGSHDSNPSLANSAGMQRARQDCTAIAVIYAEAALNHLSHDAAAIANAQHALQTYLENHVYVFHQGQDAVGVPSCCAKSTCKKNWGVGAPLDACPVPAHAPHGLQVCPDNPVAYADELG